MIDGLIPYKPFEPEEWQIEAFKSTAPVLLLTGNSGGGKSRCALEKLHLFCQVYENACCLIVRKKEVNLANSSVLVLSETVIGAKGGVRHNKKDRRFEYPNGSMIFYSGMQSENQREGIRSIGKEGKIDMVIMEEAIEFVEDDFNELRFRMRGTAAPYTQIVVCTNPGEPLHWINVRLIIGGEAEVIESWGENNKYNPPSYSKNMKAATGVIGARLGRGLWVAGEGRMIETWSRQECVTEEAEYYPGAGKVLWWMDDGYSGEEDRITGYFKNNSNPRVILWVQKRTDGSYVIFDESYKVGELSSVHIKREMGRYERPDLVIYDGAAVSLGGQLRIFGLKAKGIRCGIEDGTRAVQEFYGKDNNGVRRLLVHPRCKKLILENSSWSREDGRPTDTFNHGPDAVRYGIAYELSKGVYVGDSNNNEFDKQMALIYARVEDEVNNLWMQVKLVE